MDASLNSAAERYSKSKWIWSDKAAATSTPPATIYLRRVINLRQPPSAADTMVTCDNEFKLFINGKLAASGDKWMEPVKADLKQFLVDGKNVLTVIATNNTDKPSPAGFWMNMQVKFGEAFDAKAPVIVGSANAWKVSTKEPPKEWEAVEFNDSKWPKAVALGDASMTPWMLSSKLPNDDASAHPPEIRSVLCVSDGLTTALGRPNREQVVTVRPDGLTTLQALEMTNGPTLAAMLRDGAARYVKENDSSKIVNEIFEKALGRKPTPDEAQMANDLVGTPAKADGVEDLLWTVVMLPEFQLIR
jgi:hypothetical protein